MAARPGAPHDPPDRLSPAEANAAKIIAAKRESESRPAPTRRQREAGEAFYARRNELYRTMAIEEANAIARAEISARYANEPKTASRTRPTRSRERRSHTSRSNRASTSRGDSGDSDSDGPEPASRRRIPVHIEGTPSAESEAAVARFLARFLEREHPGTTWTVTTPRAAA